MYNEKGGPGEFFWENGRKEKHGKTPKPKTKLKRGKGRKKNWEKGVGKMPEIMVQRGVRRKLISRFTFTSPWGRGEKTGGKKKN